MGSKNRIAKHILPIILKDRKPGQWYVEPFVGGANMIDKVDGNRVGYDINPHVIRAICDIRDHVEDLPESVSEQQYKSLKGSIPEKFTSWIRFVCSFGGKFENGYSREKGSNDTTFCGYGKRNALKQSPNIQGVNFICESFFNLSFNDAVIYCDPPYKGTTSYKTDSFPYDDFYEWCRRMKRNGCDIYISEYSMPGDFTCVWQGEIKTNFASSRTTATHNAIEKLFTLKNDFDGDFNF